VSDLDDNDDTEDDDDWMLPPRRRDGSFALYEFEGADDRLPEVLEAIAAWLRECAEYLLEQMIVHVDDGWAAVSVVVHELRPGDLIEQLEWQGHPDLAASLAVSVKTHGVREGLRRIGVSYR